MNHTRRLLAQSIFLTPIFYGCGQTTLRGGVAQTGVSVNALPMLRTWQEMGVHRTGSDGEELAVKWLSKIASDCGVYSEEQKYAFPQTIPGACYLKIGETHVEAFPLFDGSHTSGEGLVGTLTTSVETGGILVVEASANGEYEADYVKARLQTNCKAIVVISKSSIPGMALINASRRDHPSVPVVLVSSAARGRILQSAASRETAKVVVQWERKRSMSTNVVVRLAGRDGGLPPLIVNTTLTSWWQSVGERGGGLLCWIACLQALTEIQPPRPVVLLASSGHELGHLGMDAFQSREPELLRSAHAWLHLGANIGAAGSKIVLQGSSNLWLKNARAAMESEKLEPVAVIEPGQKPYGEVRNIFDEGGRYLSILGTPSPFFHRSDDVLPHAVDIPVVEATVRASKKIALGLASG